MGMKQVEGAHVPYPEVCRAANGHTRRNTFISSPAVILFTENTVLYYNYNSGYKCRGLAIILCPVLVKCLIR